MRNLSTGEGSGIGAGVGCGEVEVGGGGGGGSRDACLCSDAVVLSELRSPLRDQKVSNYYITAS